jgi:hypothetical protein
MDDGGPRSLWETGYLTLHNGAWAFCGAAHPQESHTWRNIGGLPLEAIRSRRDWTDREASDPR